MVEMPKNQDTPKFENPNYGNARGKAASTANSGKIDHVNPDANPGHVQGSSRPDVNSAVGGWGADVDRPLVVKPNDKENLEGPVTEPHGIRRV